MVAEAGLVEDGHTGIVRRGIVIMRKRQRADFRFPPAAICSQLSGLRVQLSVSNGCFFEGRLLVRLRLRAD